MGKGLGGCLGEGEEDAGPNRSANGDGRWKGMGEVGQGLSSSGEVGRIDGDELSSSDEHGGTNRLVDGDS